jgi:hypothetical protein
VAQQEKKLVDSELTPKEKPTRLAPKAATGSGSIKNDTKLYPIPSKIPSKPKSVESTQAKESDLAEPAVTGRKRISRGIVGKIIGVAVGVLVLIIAVFAVLIYGFQSMSSLTYAASSGIPFPAERVNGHFVSYHDYLFEVIANQKAYQSNAKLNNQATADWNSASGKKLLTQMRQHALIKLEDDVITAQLASKYKLGVTDKEIDGLLNTFYQKYGGKDTLLRTLSQFYGWNLNSFKDVLRKRLLAQKVQTAVANDPAVDRQTKAKAQDVLTKLKAGADFAATAKQYSQSADASAGGDLGIVAKGQVEDAVFTVATALQPGSLSDVVKTQYGYQIIKVIDKSDSGIHMMHILIQAVSYSDYFSQQEKAAKVTTFVKA